LPDSFSFFQTGYLRHVKSYKDPVQNAAAIGIGQEGSDGVDLTGKVVVVTGANSGLGKQVATYAAAKGATLYMLCRNGDRAREAKEEIEKATASAKPKVRIVLADVSELEQVRGAAKEIQEKESAVHAIVCNAGVLLNDRTMTSEGHEATYASHLLGGSYLLSQLLLPQLTAAGDQARVIFVTSVSPVFSVGFYDEPFWLVAICLVLFVSQLPRSRYLFSSLPNGNPEGRDVQFQTS